MREFWVVEFKSRGQWIPIPKTARLTKPGAEVAEANTRAGLAGPGLRMPELRVECYAAALRGTCRRCHCVNVDPCPQGCAWADETRTLCTACLTPAELGARDDRLEAKRGPSSPRKKLRTPKRRARGRR